MQCAEVRDRKESESEEGSEKRKTKMQKTMGTDRKYLYPYLCYICRAGLRQTPAFCCQF